MKSRYAQCKSFHHNGTNHCDLCGVYLDSRPIELCDLSKLCDLFVITLMTIGYDLLKKNLRYIYIYIFFLVFLRYWVTLKPIQI